MPIYEYRCASCGHELEALQKLSDAPLTVCPTCHRAELVKRVSAAGFQLKGSGWYVTDFRNSGNRKPAKEQAGKAAINGNDEAKAPEATSSKTTSTTTPSGTGPESKAPASTDKTGT